ncbi:MAG: hypothetical protein QME94_17970, partial [Anaerolineae bacterium]|nr:hypothetical protein [Anaerolineae bacterium]
MQTLQESLAAHGEVTLRAMAGQWGVEVADLATLPARLAEAMLEPQRLQAFLEGLDGEARASPRPGAPAAWP